jgi:nitrogen fixation NifU-like protein
VEVHHVNPSCGDEVTLRVELDGDTVTAVTHESLGCSISQAATSVMSDLVIGKPVAEGMATYEKFLELMQGRGKAVEPDSEDAEVLEDGVAFAGVAQFPARVKCALLGWSAWRDATAQALAKTEGVSNV